MAEQGAIHITWGEGRPGVAETKALEVFGSALAYYDGLAKSGRISGYRVYASTSRSAGQLTIDGELATLAQILTEPESLVELAKASAVVQDVNVELLLGGTADGVAAFFMRGMEALKTAGLSS